MIESSPVHQVQEWYKSLSSSQREMLQYQIQARRNEYYRQIMPVKGPHPTFQPITTPIEAQRIVILGSYYEAVGLLFKAQKLVIAPLRRYLGKRMVKEAIEQANAELERMTAVCERGDWRPLKQKWMQQLQNPQRPKITGDPLVDIHNRTEFKLNEIQFRNRLSLYNFGATQRLLDLIPDFTDPLDPRSVDPNPIIPTSMS